ncbi:V(D)J recombination-activating protein 1-like [Strongylocentrotus purpuratus]|uniref:RING-type domain-containing protein n=1 Tax=Strongylocentrotus purpuratus TaxID=7668 RepID=A0A7M7N4C6_STRPU|nr:V(D)J recombination-activating protein 1-like [Strongylocentrotus purpuratus]
MEQHINCLSLLCRFCGRRVETELGKKGHAYMVSDYHQLILQKFNIDISEDTSDIHPNKFCCTCYCQLTIKKPSNLTPKNWDSHKRTSDCQTCTHFKQTQAPGRPKKRKVGGRPPATTTPQSHFSKLGVSATKGNQKYNIDQDTFHIDDSLQFLLCSVCRSVVSCPVESPCNHLFCLDCISSLFAKVSVSCPLCDLQFHYSQTHTPATYIITLLHNLHVQCSLCKTSMHYTKTSGHSCQTSNCDHTYAKSNFVDLNTQQRQQIASDYLKSQMAKSHDGLSASIGLAGRGKVNATVLFTFISFIILYMYI